MNVEIGSTLVNGFAMNRALSVIYNNLRDSIEVNSIASKFVFADVSQMDVKFNVMQKYPIGAFKTFSNVVEADIKNIAIVPAIGYDIKRAGIVMLVDVSTMVLKGLGLVKSANITEVEILWLEYIAQSKQLISANAGNLITTGSDGKLFLSKEAMELTENKVNTIASDIEIIKVYETYLDYHPSDIKAIESIRDGLYIVIAKDQLHDDKPWLYVLSDTDAKSPVITPVREYTEFAQYPSAVGVKSYVDRRITETDKDFDKDTIVKNPSTNLWEVALDRATIKKNKNGLYAVDLDVLKKDLLAVPSIPGNVSIFNDKGYIKDDGWGITDDVEAIDDGAKKLVSKKFLNGQRITDNETSDLITTVNIKTN